MCWTCRGPPFPCFGVVSFVVTLHYPGVIYHTDEKTGDADKRRDGEEDCRDKL